MSAPDSSRRGPPKAVVLVDWEGEHLTFRGAWSAANILRDEAQKDLSREVANKRSACRMAAAVLVYTAFEGFVNHLIEILYPQIWIQERTFFRRPPYVGTTGKMKFLADGLGLKLPDRRPYKTISDLHRLRNELVHPRTVRRKGIASADRYAEQPNRVTPTAMRELARPGFVDRCFEDVAAAGDKILGAAAHKPHGEIREILKLGQHPFWGPVHVGGGRRRE